MEQYFNFTPYVTDTPVSFTITDGSFMDFIIKIQLRKISHGTDAGIK